MECSAAKLLIDRYLENQLTPVQRKVLEDHLGGCEGCSLELRRIHKVFDLVEQYFLAVRPGEGFLDDVMVGVEEGTDRRRRRATSPGSRARDAGARPRWRLLAVAVGVAAVAALVWGLLPRHGSVGELVEVNRIAWRRPPGGGAWTEVVAGARLDGGEAVRAEGGGVRIHLNDGGVIQLAGGATITLSRSLRDGPVRHRLEAGSARFRVSGGRPGGFRVQTADGTLSVEDSNEGVVSFSVEVQPDPKASSLTVMKGRVRVETTAGRRTVGEGQRCNFRARAAPSTPVPIHAPRPGGSSRARKPLRPKPPAGRPKGGRGAAGREPTPQEPAVGLRPLIEAARSPGTPEKERVEALRRLPSRVPAERAGEVRVVLLDMLHREPSDAVRDAAFSALVALKQDGLYFDALDVFQGDATLALRRKALAELVKDEAQRKETHDRLLASLTETLPPDLEPLRADLVREIAKHPQEDDLASLLGVFHDSPEEDPVREAIVTSLASYKDPAAVDALIELLRVPGRSIRAAAVGSLSKLTGHTIPYDDSVEGDPMILEEFIGRWEAWWNENRGDFQF